MDKQYEVTEAQVAHLKKVVSEIIVNDYEKQFHDLKKRFVALESREQESRNKISGYQEELKQYENCHKCHTDPAQFVEVGIQCDFIETNGQVVQQRPYYVIEHSSNNSNNPNNIPTNPTPPHANAVHSNGIANNSQIFHATQNTGSTNNRNNNDDDDDSDVIIIDD